MIICSVAHARSSDRRVLYISLVLVSVWVEKVLLLDGLEPTTIFDFLRKIDLIRRALRAEIKMATTPNRLVPD